MANSNQYVVVNDTNKNVSVKTTTNKVILAEINGSNRVDVRSSGSTVEILENSTSVTLVELSYASNRSGLSKSEIEELLSGLATKAELNSESNIRKNKDSELANLISNETTGRLIQASALDNRIKAFESFGLYLDDDGDLCQED